MGSTGSIGRQTLEVVASLPDELEVVALAAGSNAERLEAQARAFRPQLVALGDEAAARQLSRRLAGTGITVVGGREGILAVATLAAAEVVLNAITGVAGLEPTLSALETGHDLALANKESLVAGGHLIAAAQAVGGGRLLPVDSEHAAILQCLGAQPEAASELWLTASGGPFLGKTQAELATVTPKQAMAHPNWQMGPKVTVDSATLMNKGLEVIEAYWLFHFPWEHIKVVIHPQSLIHSLVAYRDGSLLAQLGVADMRLPIQYALSWPRRWPAPVPFLDPLHLGRLDFLAPDQEAFPALRLAYQAGQAGGGAPVVLNAADEVAVARFLAGKLSFTGIAGLVEEALAHFGGVPGGGLEEVLALDREVREWAASWRG